MKNNLLILGCYGLKDGYYAYSKYFNQHFDNISFFPLFELRDRLNEKNPKYYIEDIKDIIENRQIDNSLYTNNLITNKCFHNTILLCHNNDFLKSFNLQDSNFFDTLVSWKKELNFKLIQVNWDPDINNINWEKLNNIDIIYCSNPFYLCRNNTVIFNQGFCEKTSKHLELEEFKCDVSFIGTTLYDGWPENNVNRRKVLDKIYQNKDIKLHIYGPEFLQNLYPDSYKGFIKYEDCYKVFSNSKINLNISPLTEIKYNDEYYYSERLPQIIGCEGIMLSNNDFGNMLVRNKDYIYLENLDNLLEIINKYKDGRCREKMLNRVRKRKDLFNYKYIIASLFDNSILKIVDKIYYINLDSRKDRNKKILNQIRKIDPYLEKTERFEAIYNQKGWIGCAESHLEILKKYIENDYQNVMVLEDDFSFRNFDFKEKIKNLFTYDNDFDILLLSCNIIDSVNTEKEDIIKVLKSLTTSGYIINKKIYSKLLEVWTEGLEKLKQDPDLNRNSYSCDVSWQKLQIENKVYSSRESIGFQISDFSDIEQRIVSYEC